MAVDSTRLILATRRGAGGIAVVAIEGAGRHDRIGRHLRDSLGRPLGPSSVRHGRPIRATLLGDHGPIDDVLVVERPAFDRTELHVHASDAVLGAIETVLGRLAEAAPTDRWDRLLREAASTPQLALALEQLALGGDAAARRERATAEGDAPKLAALRARSFVASALCRTHTVVLVGQRNAGKSTLFNALLGHERALTSASPGATRDPVVAAVFLDGYPCRLMDTAGEGSPADAIEAMAQRQAALAASGDATIVRVVDTSRPRGEVDAAGPLRADLVVCNKRDLGVHADWRELADGALCVSATSVDDRRELLREFGARVRRHRGLPRAPSSGVGGLACLDRWDDSGSVVDGLASPGSNG